MEEEERQAVADKCDKRRQQDMYARDRSTNDALTSCTCLLGHHRGLPLATVD